MTVADIHIYVLPQTAHLALSGMVCHSSRTENSHVNVLITFFGLSLWLGSHVLVYDFPLDICAVAVLQLDRLRVCPIDPRGLDFGISMPTQLWQRFATLS